MPPIPFRMNPVKGWSIADTVWEMAKAGHYDGQNVFELVDDVLLCFGNVDLPGTMKLPSKLRFATDKPDLSSCFWDNFFVKDLDVYCRNSIDSTGLFIVNTPITRLNFYARKGARRSTTSHRYGFAYFCERAFNLVSATLNLGSVWNHNGAVYAFATCPKLEELRIISDVPTSMHGFINFASGATKLANIYIADSISPSAPGGADKNAYNFLRDSPLTIDSIKSVTRFFLRGTKAAFENGAYISVGKASNISTGDLTITQHKDPDGTVSEKQWSTTYNGTTYYANKDLWTCLMLLYGTDTLTLDGKEYTGMGFGAQTYPTFV